MYSILPWMSNVKHEHNGLRVFEILAYLGERGQTDGRTDRPTRPFHLVSSYSYAATNIEDDEL